MKKKIIFISCIIVYLLLITIFSFVFNRYNYKTTDEAKQHFCDDFNQKYNTQVANYDRFVLIGSYKKGYLFADYNLKLFTVNDVSKISVPMVIEIDDLELKTFKDTTFYFYSRGKLTCGLNEIYDNKLISKKELIEIKEYIESYKDTNYIVKDYIIE